MKRSTLWSFQQIITVVFVHFFFFLVLYREPFGSDCSAQSNVQAGALRDHGSSAARRTRVETSQPAEITGEERQSVKVNRGSVPNRILLSSILNDSVQCTCFVWE